MKQKKTLSEIIGIILLIAMLCLLGSGCKANTTKYDIDEINKGEAWKKVADEVFISRGSYAMVNMVLVVSKGEAALIDAGADEAEALRVLEYLEGHRLTIKKIFLTHRHADHVGNLSMFQVAEENIFDYSNTTDNQIVKMGDRSFKILFTPGHANDNHISIELVEDKILVAGDVAVTSLPPLVAYGGSGSTLENTLEKIKKNNYDLIIPGHGNLMDAKRTIEIQLDYLKNTKKLLMELIEAGKSVQEARKIKLKDCVSGTTGFTATAQTEHIKAIDILYYEIKAEMKNK